MLRQDKIVRWQTTFFNEAAPQEHAQLTNITISVEAMERAIREIKPNADAVPDGVPAILLAKCSKALAQPLCILCRPTTSAEEVSCLQQDVDAVYAWSATSNMQFNEEKFELLRHGHNQEIKEILLHTEGGQGITPQTHFKCLGVQFSEHCLIQYHIGEAVKKARTFTSREPLLD
ncbi:hypothetical protein Pmani_000970 [Petrolisthes manimaculis]|uniref:Uncharacterized protein n=1 Tax=Petrolisthes manimaculis TaxID=1843537 RepID=A0AAE1QP27_9EUCA|nr:hypothetical protein Pmani_000970 [Petrolisthes manimaculis]